jgi:hypothetical protein
MRKRPSKEELALYKEENVFIRIGHVLITPVFIALFLVAGILFFVGFFVLGCMEFLGLGYIITGEFGGFMRWYFEGIFGKSFDDDDKPVKSFWQKYEERRAIKKELKSFKQELKALDRNNHENL